MAYRASLTLCNVDKASLRRWAEGAVDNGEGANNEDR